MSYKLQRILSTSIFNLTIPNKKLSNFLCREYSRTSIANQWAQKQAENPIDASSVGVIFFSPQKIHIRSGIYVQIWKHNHRARTHARIFIYCTHVGEKNLIARKRRDTHRRGFRGALVRWSSFTLTGFLRDSRCKRKFRGAVNKLMQLHARLANLPNEQWKNHNLLVCTHSFALFLPLSQQRMYIYIL